MSSRSLALVALFGVQLLYGINYTFAKAVINQGYIKPFALVVLRVFGAVILFWVLGFFLPKEKIDKKDFKTFVIAACFGVGINMIFFLKGLELTTPIHASSIMTITPITILLLSAYFLKERLTAVKVVGAVLGFTGAIILSIYGKSLRVEDNVLLGNTFIFLNATSYSIYIIIIKKLASKYHPLTFVRWLFLFGLLLVTPFGYSELQDIQMSTFTPYIYFSVGFIIIGATFGTYLLNVLAISRLKASTVGIFIYIQPVLAGIFAILMGADTLGTVKVLAMLIIFLGVYLVSKK